MSAEVQLLTHDTRSNTSTFSFKQLDTDHWLESNPQTQHIDIYVMILWAYPPLPLGKLNNINSHNVSYQMDFGINTVPL